MAARTLVELAELVQGRIVGEGSREIRDAGSINRAGPHDLTFAVDERNLRLLTDSAAGACLVSEKLTGPAERLCLSASLVVVADPLDAFLKILSLFRPQPQRLELGVSPAAHVSPSATIGPDTNIHPGVFIGAGAVVGARCDLHPGVCLGAGAQVGDDSILHPHVVLYPGVAVGARVVLHAGVVLGADGFGYRFRGGRFEKIPQLGSVIVEDDVEIGANATIDRGMIGPTVIGAGSKLDNLVMIGHNCELGKHNVLASQVGLAGSVTSGDYVRLAGQVGVADHVHLGQGCTLGAKSGVHRDVPAGETHIGYPARPEMEELKIVMSTARTPEMRRQIRELQEWLVDLERRLGSLTEQSQG